MGTLWRKRFALPLAGVVVAACGGAAMPSATPLSPNEPAPAATPVARGATPRPAPSASAAAPHTAPSAQAATSPASPATVSTAAPPPQSTASTDSEATPPGAPVVKLVAAGAAPRAKLRYHVTGEHQLQVRMITRMDMQATLHGNTAPRVKLPPTEAHMTVHERARVTGGADYQYSIDQFATQPDPSTPQELAAKMDAQLANLVGVTGRATVTSRGFLRNSRVNVPAGADPEIRKMVKSLNGSVQSAVSPLPEQPVGIGAKWDVTSHLTVRGMSVKQITHAKLVARHGHQIVISARLEQTGTPQTVQAPGLPPNARLDLVSLTSTGTAKSRIDLSHLVPTQSHVNMHSRAVMHITTNTLTQPMTTDMTMSVELTANTP